MIYFNTVRLDGQSRLYIDSKIREALHLEKNGTIDIACVGNAVVLTASGENIDVVNTVEITNTLRRVNASISK